MRTREHLIWAGAMLVAVCVISAAVWYPAHERLAIVERMQEVKPVCAPTLAPRRKKLRVGTWTGTIPTGKAAPTLESE